MATNDAELKEQYTTSIVHFLRNAQRTLDEALGNVGYVVNADARLNKSNMERAEGDQAVADLTELVDEALNYIRAVRNNMAVAGEQCESLTDEFERSGVLESNMRRYLEDAFLNAKHASRDAKKIIAEIEDGADSITNEAVDMSYGFFTDADVLESAEASVRGAEMEVEQALNTYAQLAELEAR